MRPIKSIYYYYYYFTMYPRKMSLSLCVEKIQKVKGMTHSLFEIRPHSKRQDMPLSAQLRNEFMIRLL